MTIFILSQDHAETAKWLDNRSLDKMIKDISQVLVTAATWGKIHEYEIEKAMTEKALKNIPKNKKYAINMKSMTQIKIELKYDDWVHFSRECRANYLWLVKLGLKILDEESYRLSEHVFFSKMNKFAEAIVWARDNVPDLPGAYNAELNRVTKLEITTVPLVMPKKYIIYISHGFETPIPWLENSYRNYYQAKLNRREPFPQFKKKSTWTRRQKPEWLNVLF